MRIIEFRGKRDIYGGWIYGDILQLTSGIVISSKDGGLSNIDPATLGQYIGRTDINGKRIYEGDFLRVTDELRKNCGEPYALPKRLQEPR